MAVVLYNKDPELRTTLLHDFTDEELGIKSKSVRWEDLDINYNITGVLGYSCLEDYNKSLAHNKLLQLAKHYNKCDQHEIKGSYYSAYYSEKEKEIEITESTNTYKYGSEVKFKNQSDLEKCIEDNRDLWEIYLGVK